MSLGAGQAGGGGKEMQQEKRKERVESPGTTRGVKTFDFYAEVLWRRPTEAVALKVN